MFKSECTYLNSLVNLPAAYGQCQSVYNFSNVLFLTFHVPLFLNMFNTCIMSLETFVPQHTDNSNITGGSSWNVWSIHWLLLPFGVFIHHPLDTDKKTSTPTADQAWAYRKTFVLFGLQSSLSCLSCSLDIYRMLLLPVRIHLVSCDPPPPPPPPYHDYFSGPKFWILYQVPWSAAPSIFYASFNFPV